MKPFCYTSIAIYLLTICSITLFIYLLEDPLKRRYEKHYITQKGRGEVDSTDSRSISELLAHEEELVGDHIKASIGERALEDSGGVQNPEQHQLYNQQGGHYDKKFHEFFRIHHDCEEAVRTTCPKSPLYLTQYKDTEKISNKQNVTEKLVDHVKIRNCNEGKELLAELAKAPLSDLLDIVVIVSAEMDFRSLLSNWEAEFRSFYTIFILDDSVSANALPEIPDWIKYEMHTTDSIRAALGVNSWVVGSRYGGFGDAYSLVPFAFWTSQKEFIYTITAHYKHSMLEDSCFTLLERHMLNMLLPVVDNFRECCSVDAPIAQRIHNKCRIDDKRNDFFMRKTVISFELGDELGSNIHNHDTYNVPIGLNSLFFRSNNLMISSRHMANSFWLFTPSINSLYDNQNFSEYAEVTRFISIWMQKSFLDWTRAGIKVLRVKARYEKTERSPISDHGNDIKPGNNRRSVMSTTDDDSNMIHFDRKYSLYGLSRGNKRYFLARWNKLSNHSKNLLEMVYSRIKSFDISKYNAQRNSQCLGQKEYPFTCYITELDNYVLNNESYPLLVYMYKQTQSYFQVWASRKAFLSTLFPVSIRSSYHPQKDKSCAIITISHNEKHLFPIWYRYYSKYFEPRDMFVLDHMTTDGSLDNLHKEVRLLKYNVKYAMPVHDRSETIRFYQDFLLRMNYSCVVYTDVDEIIVPKPNVYPGGLKQYLNMFIDKGEAMLYVRVKAYELGHMAYGEEGKSETIEPPLNWSDNILRQRSYYAENSPYNKPLITKLPLYYRPGFHNLYDHWIHMETDENLVMFHLSSIDKEWCLEKMKYKFELTAKMNPEEFGGGYADHWKRYHHDMSKGITCKYANACLIRVEVKGVLPSSKASVQLTSSPVASANGGTEEGEKSSPSASKRIELRPYDNLGTTPMFKLDELWRTAVV